MTMTADELDTQEQLARIRRESADAIEKALHAINHESEARWRPWQVVAAAAGAGAALFAAGGGFVAALVAAFLNLKLHG
jgi:hypothetical protein